MSSAPPNDWLTSPLGDLARVYSGGTPLRGVPAYWGGRIPWVTTAEINGDLIDSAREAITDAGLNASAARVAPRGTLLLAMYGQGKTRGKVGILGIAAAMNQACAAIDPGRHLDARYLFHYLTSQYDSIRSMSNAGSQENLSGELVRKIPILVPPIPEQRTIGQVLDDADRLISALQRQITKKQAIKQGMMQQLLTGHTRLPGFDLTWGSTALGDVVRVAGGGTPSRSITSYWGGSIPWATIKDISTFNPKATQEYVTPAALQASSARLVTAGTPVLASRMLVGKAVRFDVEVAINQDLKALYVSDRIDPSFLCHWFDANGHILAASAGGSTVAGTSTRQIQALTIALPSTEEQRAIASVLDDSDEELKALHRRLTKARAIKTGMMQELLTGRSRLSLQEQAA